MPIRLLLPIGILVVVCGCGKEPNIIDGNPTALVIAPATDLITIKGTETFTSTLTYTNGKSETVPATWTSSAPDIATVDSSTGRVVGISPGQTTITAQYQGTTKTQNLRVVPDYQGRWQGDWAVTACISDGDWLLANVCTAGYPAGSLWAITLDATQSRDAITGTIDFGDNAPGAVTGSIAMNGHLEFTGTYTIVVDGLPVEVTVANCDTISMDNQRLTGTFRLTLRTAGMQGSVSIDGNLHVVGKGTAGPPPSSLGIAHVFRRAGAIR